MSLSDLIWAEKYRPKTINDVVLPAATKKMLKEQLTSGKVPNLLFASSSPGTGKTTCAYAIANELSADLLFINASLDGNIDLLRTKLTQFVSSVSFTDSKKIVVLDEFDYVTSATSPAIRGFLDEFSSNATFIFTCNYPERIIPAVQSRLTRIDFKFPKEEVQSAMMQMLKNVCSILDKESVKYDKKTVAALVQKNFPDFRRTISELQRYSSSGEIDSGILATIDDSGMTELIAALREKNFNKCRQWVANNQMDTAQFYRMFYDKISLMLVPQSVPQLILLIGDAQFKAAHSIDLEINSMAFIVSFLSSCVFK